MSRSFRTTKPLQEIGCVTEQSLFDAFLSLKETGAIEEFRFFLSLITKTPILTEVDDEIQSRFLACEETTLTPEDGKPLLLCALANWIAVGFPNVPWDCDFVTVRFNELLPNDETISVDEKIDNLTRADHVTSICRRHIARNQNDLDLGILWDRRKAAFPSLRFGPDVETQITNLPRAHGSTIINRLAELHTTAEKWHRTGGAMPDWTCKVTPESRRVCDNPKLREARRFRSCSGTSKLFIWHARFGNRGRIHLRFDADARVVEIGYIGEHLPL